MFPLFFISVLTEAHPNTMMKIFGVFFGVLFVGSAISWGYKYKLISGSKVLNNDIFFDGTHFEEGVVFVIQNTIDLTDGIPFDFTNYEDFLRVRGRMIDEIQSYEALKEKVKDTMVKDLQNIKQKDFEEESKDMLEKDKTDPNNSMRYATLIELALKVDLRDNYDIKFSYCVIYTRKPFSQSLIFNRGIQFIDGFNLYCNYEKAFLIFFPLLTRDIPSFYCAFTKQDVGDLITESMKAPEIRDLENETLKSLLFRELSTNALDRVYIEELEDTIRRLTIKLEQSQAWAMKYEDQARENFGREKKEAKYKKSAGIFGCLFWILLLFVFYNLGKGVG